MPEDQNKNQKFLFLLTQDQSFCLIPLANMTQIVKKLLSPNAQLKMFFPRPSGSITLGKGDNSLIPLFLRLTIILIIRKPSITLSSFRIITTNILGFSPLIKFHAIQTLPLWFNQWWKLFEAETSILSSPLCNKLLEYSNNFPSPSPFNLVPP
jgi:hypothetical protein